MGFSSHLYNIKVSNKRKEMLIIEIECKKRESKEKLGALISGPDDSSIWGV